MKRDSLFAGGVAALAYLNGLANRPVLDDGWVIFGNPLVKSLSHVGDIFRSSYGVAGAPTLAGVYRPITTLTYALNYAVGGDDVVGYHAVNLALHVGATLLVVALMRMLSDRAWAPLVAGGLFALHPVHVEAVTGLVGRAELLATVFSLGALLLALRGRGGPGALLLLCGLLSKESAAVTPILFALIKLSPLSPLGERDRVRGRSRGNDAPPEGELSDERVSRVRTLTVGVSLLVAFVPALLLRPQLVVPIEARWFGTWPYDVVALTMTRALAEYWRLLVFPHPLGLDFYYSTKIGFIEHVNTAVVVSTLVWLSVLVLAFASRRRAPLRFLGLLWVFIALAPVSNLVPTGVLMAERLLYLPSVGFCLWLGHSLATPRWLKVAAVIALAFAVKTVIRNSEWRDGLTLWEVELAKTPNNAVINNNLAVEYAGLGNAARALELATAATRIAPQYWRAHVNRGIALQRLGRPAEADQAFAQAQAIEPRADDPLFFRALLLAEQGDLTSAVLLAQQAETLAPLQARNPLWRGTWLMRLGRLAECREALLRAQALDPREPSLPGMLAVCGGPR